ncbi:MAG: hypothetical protein P9L94_03110 [Candidatus Hinthialibacter antarcticus]|nr:hypothetical protein [Candidatus Hinthialibacter antarcticus]
MDDLKHLIRRITAWMNRCWLTTHVLFVFICIGFFFSLNYILSQTWRFPALSPVTDLIAPFFRVDIFLARLCGWVGIDFYWVFVPGIFVWLFIIFILFPQVMLFFFRKQRWAALLCVIFAFQFQFVIFFAHQKYCEWSYAELRKLESKMKVEDIYRRCGRPLYMWGEKGNLGRYSNGMSQTHIEIHEDGTAIIMQTSYPWMD